MDKSDQVNKDDYCGGGGRGELRVCVCLCACLLACERRVDTIENDLQQLSSAQRANELSSPAVEVGGVGGIMRDRYLEGEISLVQGNFPLQARLLPPPLPSSLLSSLSLSLLLSSLLLCRRNLEERRLIRFSANPA